MRRSPFIPRPPCRRAYATDTTQRPALAYFQGRSSCRAAGIVGLPNVGKSTLFNALTNTQLVANYPFCTIEPNTARVEVPDTRLMELAKVANSAKITPLQIEFVDIAGLVRGASKGQGLGNQFLSNPNITHVENSVDPIRDLEILDSELVLSDMELVDRFKKKKGNPTALTKLLDKCMAALDKGMPTRRILINEEEWQHFKSLGLLTAKPTLYTCNVGETEAAEGNALSQTVLKRIHSAEPDVGVIPVCAKIEAEITQLDEAARPEFLSLYGMKESQLNKIIRETRRTLRQETYYTVGEQESRAYSYPAGCSAREAAGYIHSDFEKGFVKAEITPAAAYLAAAGRAASRIEPADYKMQDGDIMVVRFK